MDNNEHSTNLAEVGTDCISRQQAIDAVARVIVIKSRGGRGNTIAEAVDSAKAIIADNIRRLPSIQPAEPKRGKWIRDGHHIRCDQCGIYMCDTDREGDRIPTDFCPNCGADMRTAEQIVHDAIDNTPMAEDAYPGIKERLHKAVDDMREVTNGN